LVYTMPHMSTALNCVIQKLRYTHIMNCGNSPSDAPLQGHI